MADLESLLNDLANLDAQHDFDAMRSIRECIVEEHPDSEAAVEATYKLGLDFLFRQRDLTVAMECFTKAAQRKHEFWSAAARTSLGLCYFHQGRSQKALFELRRIAQTETPNPHSVTALAFMENIFESEGNAEEATRARKDRIGQLRRMIAHNAESQGPASERMYHMYQLGLALHDNGEDAEAKVVLEDAKAAGPEVLGADLYRAVIEALQH